MFRKLLLFVAVASLIPAPAHAQLVVFDPGNLVQTTLIAYRMDRQLGSRDAVLRDLHRDLKV